MYLKPVTRTTADHYIKAPVRDFTPEPPVNSPHDSEYYGILNLSPVSSAPCYMSMSLYPSYHTIHVVATVAKLPHECVGNLVIFFLNL